MGLLDKASRGFSRAGEETVRVVDYDSVPVDEKESKEPRERKVKAPREPKAPKERRKLGIGAAAKGLLPHRDEEDEIEEPTGPDALDQEGPNGFEDDELLSMATSSSTELPEASPRKLPAASTAFEIDDDEPNFYEEKQKQWEGKAGGKNAIDELVPEIGAIQDVLDVLKIPATFTIREDILMPDDFDNIEFDIQVPQGYDIGQVQFFQERAEATVKEYLRLLELRNEHIAKLATTVDRLQVDANNLKYDNQIAAGIGIIPTSDSVDIENENMELKLQLQKLKDAQKTTINSDERKVYEDMRNQLSLLTRENEDLKEKNYELRTILAQYDESGDEMVTAPSLETDHDSAEIIFQTMDDDDELPQMNASGSYELPDLGDSAMPGFTDPDEVAKAMQPTNSSFEMPEDDVADFLNTLTPESSDSDISASSFGLADSDDDEDDDELDRLMRDWKN